MYKIGIVLHEGPRFGAGFTVITTPSEDRVAIEKYGLRVIVYNDRSPVSNVKIPVCFSISGQGEQDIENRLLHGSPFTTNDKGEFDLVGELPANIVEKTSFTVEFGGAKTVFSLRSAINAGAPGSTRPLREDEHTSTQSLGAISGEMGGDWQPCRTIEYGADEPHQEDKAPAAGNQPRPCPCGDPTNPIIHNPERMRETLCSILGFPESLDLHAKLQYLEKLISRMPSKKEIKALICEQQEAAIEAVVVRILSRVKEMVGEQTQQGLDSLASRQEAAEGALQEAADRIAERVAGQILWRIRKRQLALYLQSAWSWIKRIMAFTAVAWAVLSLLALYFGWISP